MIGRIDPAALPAMAGNALYLDYISGSGTAAKFYTHLPLDFAGALEQRRRYSWSRKEIFHQLTEYNAKLGDHPRARENIKALGNEGTFCVVAGQQAGFLGGPAYTAFKIVTAIRLAEYLEDYLEIKCVPVFWLASEDHDFGEINHAHFFRRDGQVGRVTFDWEHKGRPIANLPITEDVRRAYGEYFDNTLPGPYQAEVKELFSFQTEEDFCTWQSRVWSRLFSEHGLVIVEPRILRAPAPGFFRFSLEHTKEIGHRLNEVSQALLAAGYTPALTSDQAGHLYTFDSAGQRVRVQDPQLHLAEATRHPEQYSTDAALRPLFADATLPVLVSVLGPGELAYQGMLKPLYDLFDLPQPLLFPRKSYTIVAQKEAERIAQYAISAQAILTEQLDMDAVFNDLVPASEREMFALAHHGLEEALVPLQPYLEGIDPSLGRTWAQTLANATRGLDKLRDRALKARMSQLGFSKGELQTLRNTLLPRDRLQERIFPLPHFMNKYGTRFIDELFSAGELDDFTHNVLVLEDGHASS